MKKNGLQVSMNRILKRAIFLVICMICCSLIIPAGAVAVYSGGEQPQVVGGQVAGTDGAPLPGVTVAIKGAGRGTITDIGGNYSLSGLTGDAVLVFSFVGMKPQEIAVNGRSVVNITLEEDVRSVDEVVVVGYGTQRKKDLTGSISRVSGEDMIQPSVVSFDQMLQGKVAGVQISQTTGAPGGNVNVLVRGVSSITGGNQPLYVVDGFPIGSGGGGSDMLNFGGATYSSAGMANNTQNRINPLSSINPSDIESIEILKDASATAIYGSRGANGVVIITTKRGKAGKSQITADVSYGVQQVAHKLDMMNSQQFAEFIAEGRDAAWVYAGGKATDPNEIRSATTRVKPEFRDPASISLNTDWQDAIFRIAPVQNYQVSAAGGNDQIKYHLSGGYMSQEGIVEGTDYDRFNLRSNMDVQISEKLKIGSSISGSYAYGKFPNTEGHLGTRAVLSAALASSPTIPIRDENGEYVSELLNPMGVPVENPLFILENFSDKRNTANVFTNNFFEYEIIKGLRFKSSIGVSFGTNEIKLWKSSKLGSYGGATSPATAGVTKTESLNWLNENTLSYKASLKEKHVFDVFAGYTIQKDKYDRLSAGATDFPTDYVTYLSAGTVNAGTHYISEWSMLSLISRVNYSYDGKYLMTATVRRDGSSRFGSTNKWGTFPSFSAGYNISEEGFMKQLAFISNLKLRASYGISGNNQIGNYTHIGLLSSDNYVQNNQIKPGLVPSNLSNNKLTWEKSRQINIGLDLGLFEERLTLTAEVYKDKKTDLLLAVQLPAASGFYNSTQNIGEIENKGIEIALSSVNVKDRNFNWESNLTFNANKNKVLKLATEGSRIANSSYQITEVGSAVSSFYLMHAIGIFQNAEEVAGNPVQHPKTQPGDLKFEDVVADGKITASDKKIVGSPWPDFSWGFTNKWTWKNFTLGVFINGTHGGYNYFVAGETILNSAGVQNQLAMADKRWKSEADPGDGLIPRAIRSTHAYGFSSSSRFLFDTSYIRIKNINFSYALPYEMISRLSLSSMSVFVDVANLHTFTDYPGYDPESSTAGDNITNSGIDYNTYPLARTFTLGFKLSF
ncbi:MAG: TonB-dependent receptor [Prolixibacteraceae bacterium]